MGILGMAGLPHWRYGLTAPNGRRAHLRPPVCSFTLVGIAGEDDLDAPDLPVIHLKEISAARGQADKIQGKAESVAHVADGSMLLKKSSWILANHDSVV